MPCCPSVPAQCLDMTSPRLRTYTKADGRRRRGEGGQERLGGSKKRVSQLEKRLGTCAIKHTHIELTRRSVTQVAVPQVALIRLLVGCPAEP